MTPSVMSAAPRKSSTSSTRPALSASHPAFAAKPGAASFFAPAVQPKLEVNKPGDKFEQEADAMAESVMRMPSPVASLGGASAVQRKGGDGIPSVSPGAESAIRSKATGGEPLSSEVRSTMEPRFGADFGSVRVHNDSESGALNQGLGARAFTYQNHIFFSRDQYQPGGSEGRRLLAHELTHTLQQGAAVKTKADAAHAAARKEAVTSSEVAEIVSGVFSPSQKVRDEIAAQGGKGLDVRVAVKGLTGEGRVKVKASRDKRYHSITQGSMPLLNPWLQQIGGMYLNFSVDKDEIRHGYASLTSGGGDANDWLRALQKNADLLGGLGLKVNNLPKPLNEYANGKLTLGVKDLKVVVGGFLDVKLNLSVEDAGAPKIDATGDVNIKGMVKGQLNLNNAQGRLAGQVSLGVDYKDFGGLAIIKLNPDGSVDVSGRAAYNKNKLSGEIQFASTDLESANKFARDAIAAAGGKENIQESTAPPPPVPAPKPGKKERALAATGLLAFNLTEWFAGTVHVVVDGKGHLTVVGKIAPPGEIRLFDEKPLLDKELIKFEAKAYYGIPVVGNLNLFANISLRAVARLGPAKIYQIEILGTYSTDPEIQKSIQIAGSINISAYGGLILRAEGGAGVEILDHDLKFGIGLHADVGVKAYAEARPTVGYRDPGVFYISGTLELVAQPMLGLGGDFFIALVTPWWSPLSDDRWTWPLFSKEWPLTDPIGISASLKDYVFGSGAVPDITLKAPEFDPSKFMTTMVDRNLPDKAGGQGSGHGTFKDDGTVQKPEIPPKKPAPKKADAKPPKKGAPLKGGKSAAPDAKAAKDKDSGKILQNAAKPLAGLKSKAPFTRPALDGELGRIKKQVPGVDFNVRSPDGVWIVTPKAGAKTGKGLELGVKDAGTTPAESHVSSAQTAPVTVTIRFTMVSTSHTLTTTASGDSVRVTMASNGGDLNRKITDLLRAVDDPKRMIPRRERVKSELNRIKETLNDYNHLKAAYERSLGAGSEGTLRPVPPAFVREFSNTLIGEIVGLATKYGFRDLLAQTFLPDPLPARRHIPEPVKSNIRKRLYERGSSWTSVRDKVERNDVTNIDAQIADRIIAPRAAGNEKAATEAMRDLKRRGKVLDHASLDHFEPRFSYVTRNLSEYAVDHDPPLAEHWVKHGGNRTSDAERRDTVDGKGVSKLELVTKRFNSQKGSRDPSGEAQHFKKYAWISPPFTSEIGKDINGKPNNQDLVTIDDHSLTDEHGTPYLPS